jgi:hypothetical protein
MDAATIFVLVATVLFVGFIVWLNVYAPREKENKKPATSESNTNQIPDAQSPTKAGKKQKRGMRKPLIDPQFKRPL